MSGTPGPLETGRSPGPAGVGGDRGSRGDGSSTTSTMPGAPVRVWPATISVVLQAFPNVGQVRATTTGSVGAGSCRGADAGVCAAGVCVVGGTGRGLVPIASRSVAPAGPPADRRVHRLLRQLRRGPVRLEGAAATRYGWRSATDCNSGSMPSGPAPRPVPSRRCWIIWPPAAPSRCWSVR